MVNVLDVEVISLAKPKMADVQTIQDSSGKVIWKMTYNIATGNVDMEGDVLKNGALEKKEDRSLAYPADHFGHLTQQSVNIEAGSPWHVVSVGSSGWSGTTNKEEEKEDMKKKTEVLGTAVVVNTKLREKVLDQEITLAGSLLDMKVREQILFLFHTELFKDSETKPEDLAVKFIEKMRYEYEVVEEKEE